MRQMKKSAIRTLKGASASKAETNAAVPAEADTATVST